MRKVIVARDVPAPAGSGYDYITKRKEAWFHQFSASVSGAIVAIVEYAGGEIDRVPIELLKFCDTPSLDMGSKVDVE